MPFECGIIERKSELKRRIITILILLVTWVVAINAVSAQSLKAISFNLRSSSFSREDGDNAWVRRAGAVKTMIKNEDPDVMGVQEALLDQLSYLDNAFKYTYRRVGIGRDNGLSRGEHMAIYYNIKRIALVWHTTRWLSPTPYNVSTGWDATSPRTVTIAKFRVIATGKVFYYFNTHLDLIGKESRRESILLITKLIKTLTGNVPVIFGGDFNTVASDPILEPLDEVDLELARTQAPISDNKASFNTFGKARAKTIDELYIRKINLISFETLDGDYGVPYISDHYPIAIEFELE